MKVIFEDFNVTFEDLEPGETFTIVDIITDGTAKVIHYYLKTKCSLPGCESTGEAFDMIYNTSTAIAFDTKVHRVNSEIHIEEEDS